jgi:plastocyanin
MSNETLFYVCGIALAVSAVVVSFIGLRVKGFPGKAGPFVALLFVVLIGATTTFAVLHAKDEDKAKAAELTKANEEAEKEESSPVEEKSEATPESGPKDENRVAPAPKSEAAKGPGETLQLAASETDLAFDKTSLTSKPGKVMIDFNNPSALEHNVAIEQNGEEIAVSETLAKGKTSVSADLAPGSYTYLCTIPGHAEAGMEGTLVVK